MSSVWQFIKRHRGKIVAGSVLVGGLWISKSLFEQNREAIEDWLRRQQTANVLAQRSFTIETRKHYIFDSQQRTCDDSIVQLIPDVAGKIKSKLDVEKLADRLKDENETSNMSQDEKLQLWDEMKVDAMARVVAASYAYSILIVSLKIQVSILSSEIFRSSQSRTLDRSPLEALSDRFWATLGYPSSSQGSTSLAPADGSNQQTNDTTASAQQLFLQCIQYFIVHGVDTLVDRVHVVVGELMKDLPLTHRMTSVAVAELIADARLQLETDDCRNFSYLVLPLTAEQDAFVMPHHNKLQPMLRSMHKHLESQECRLLLTSFVDRFSREISQRLVGTHADAPDATPLPLAKLIPIFADGFSKRLSSTDFGAPIMDFLVSNQLHQFCVQVFETGCV